MKKIIGSVMAFTLVISGISFFTVQKVHAQLSIVEDIEGDIEDVLNYVENTITAAATLDQEIQITVLDQVATAIAKELLMQVTDSVVNWINSGFNGNPAFIQNPTAFFENIGDQATGEFISQNGALSSLCSPFSLQIRLAIAYQQQQNDDLNNGGDGNPYSCTLSTIINNTQNAAGSASVQGFISGDFSQGGWPAFSALVTEPQNTPNGAFMAAEDQLQQQIAAQTTEKQNELNQGGGFLSWETCTSNDSSANAAGDSADPYGTAEEDNPNENCTIQTPGSVIAAALNKHLAVPTEELELANSVNDVISDAFSELVVVALQKGLTSVSQSSASGQSYLQSAINSAGSQSFAATQATLSNTVGPFVTNSGEIASNYTSALNTIEAASSTITSAEVCYEALPTTSSSETYTQAYIKIQDNAATLAEEEASTVAPLAQTMTANVENASSTYLQFQQLYGQITSATTLTDLTGPNQTLETLSQNSLTLPTVGAIQSSSDELSSTTAQISPIQQLASTTLSACQALTPSTSTTTAATSNTSQ